MKGGGTMEWGKRLCSTVSSGPRWKEAFGQMTSFQSILHPSISPGHKAPHRSDYQVQELWKSLYAAGLSVPACSGAETPV